MNNIKEIDIFDKSQLALVNLFGNNIALNEIKSASGRNDVIDGMVSLNSTNFPYIIIDSTVGNAFEKIQYYIHRSTKEGIKPLYILSYASKELIQFLKQQNLFFIDTVGNCFINLPDLKVFVEGRKNEFSTNITPKRAFQKTGLKLIFHLLKNPTLTSASYRNISKATKISLASVSYIFEELIRDGFIIEISKERKNLSNLKRLISKWAISYAENLRPKLHRGYFISFNPQLFKNIAIIKKGNNLYVSGEYGVFYLNNSIKPEKLILYTNMRLSELAKTYKIVPVGKIKEERSKVEIIEQFWVNDIRTETNLDHNPIADPILIYADLMLSNNYRSIETAENLLNNEIRDRFLQYNFQW